MWPLLRALFSILRNASTQPVAARAGWQRAADVLFTLGVAGRAGLRAVVVLVVVLAACSSGTSTSDGGQLPSTGPSLGPTAGPSGAGAPSGNTVLKAPAGTATTTLASAADVVRHRLGRMGVSNATVTVHDDGLEVKSSADGYQLHAAAQRHATTIAPITNMVVGACNGAGIPSAGAATRCYTLDPPVTGVSAMSKMNVQSESGAGWKLTFSIDPNQYQTFRAAVESAHGSDLALVTDGVVALAFGSGVPALQSGLGPPLAEDEARRVAAALAVDSDLPVDLQAPAEPAPSGARVNVDFWTAALGVDICGTWLDNAPATGADSGVHSHGDGLVYIHPMKPEEARNNATLGLFLKGGRWEASADHLQLWDGQEHRGGVPCSDGRPAQVRWFVDGVEQHGDPSRFVPHNGQLIVLSFDSSDPPSSPPPPQFEALYVPSLGAAS